MLTGPACSINSCAIPPARNSLRWRTTLGPGGFLDGRHFGRTVRWTIERDPRGFPANTSSTTSLRLGSESPRANPFLRCLKSGCRDGRREMYL